MNHSTRRHSTFSQILTRSYTFGILLVNLATISSAEIPASFVFAAADREDGVSSNGHDVFVLVAGNLENPVGFCTAEPCVIGDTSPSAALFNSASIGLGLTWGEWQKTTATSKMRCEKDGLTEVHVKLEGLIPGGVYSIFY